MTTTKLSVLLALLLACVPLEAVVTSSDADPDVGDGDGDGDGCGLIDDQPEPAPPGAWLACHDQECSCFEHFGFECPPGSAPGCS